MAKRKPLSGSSIPKMREIIFSNTGVLDPNARNTSLLSSDADIKKIERALLSASSKSDFIVRAGEKTVDANGIFRQSWYIPETINTSELAALKTLKANSKSASSNAWRFSSRQAPMIFGNRTFVGSDAVLEAEMAMKKEMGGLYHAPTADNKNNYMYYYPSKLKNIERINAKTDRLFKDADILSATESGRREISDRNKEKKDKEKDKDTKLETRNSFRGVTRVLKSLLATGIALTAIVRRILSNMVTEGGVIRANNATATALNMNPLSVRNYNYLDRLKGMSEGTTMGAISSVNEAFGLIENLDAGVLRTILPVTENYTEADKIVRLGLTEDNTAEDITAAILDSYFNAWKDKRDEFGQQVEGLSSEKSANLLYTSLATVFPEIAAMFAQMVTDSMHGGEFTDFEGWKSSALSGIWQPSEQRYGWMTVLGNEALEASERIKSLGEYITSELMWNFKGLAGVIENIRIGNTAEENVELDKSATEKGIAFLAKGNDVLQEASSIIYKSTGYTASSLFDVDNFKSEANFFERLFRPKGSVITDDRSTEYFLAKRALEENISDPEFINALGNYLFYKQAIAETESNLNNPAGEITFNSDYESAEIVLETKRRLVHDYIEEFMGVLNLDTGSVFAPDMSSYMYRVGLLASLERHYNTEGAELSSTEKIMMSALVEAYNNSIDEELEKIKAEDYSKDPTYLREKEEQSRAKRYEEKKRERISLHEFSGRFWSQEYADKFFEWFNTTDLSPILQDIYSGKYDIEGLDSIINQAINLMLEKTADMVELEGGSAGAFNLGGKQSVDINLHLSDGTVIPVMNATGYNLDITSQAVYDIEMANS